MTSPDQPQEQEHGVYRQNLEDQRSLRQVSQELRAFLVFRGVPVDEPDAASLIRDVEALERVASWIGNRVSLG